MLERELNIPASFRRFREQFGLSKSTVARTLNIQPTSYEFEREDRANNPGVKTIFKLATIYGVSTDYLLGLTDDPTPHWNNAVESVEVQPESNLTERISNLEKRLEKLERLVGV